MRFKQTVQLHLRISRLYQLYLFGTCALACLALLLLKLPFLVKGTLFLILFFYGKQLLAQTSQISSITRDSSGQWSIHSQDQTSHTYLMLENYFLSQHVIVLTLKNNSTQRKDVLITRDMLGPKEWHRLRLVLLYD